MSNSLFKRRDLLKGVAAGTALGTLGVTNGAGNEEPSLSHVPSTRRAGASGKTSLVMSLQSDNISLDDSADRFLRITDQDQSVDVRPQSNESIELFSEFDLRIYDDGQITAEPFIASVPGVSGEDIPVTVTGDTSMFVDNPIFTGYTVQLTEDGQTITTSDEHVYGIGHPRDAFSQDSTSGEIEVTYDKSDLIDDSWTLILTLSDYRKRDGRRIQGRTSEFEYESGTFVTTFDADQVQPLPENAFRDIDVDIYNQPVDNGPFGVKRALWAATDITLDPSQNVGTVNGTVTDSNNNSVGLIDIDIINPNTGETEITTSTDENGEYTTDLLAGQYEVSVEESGFEPSNTAVTVETDKTQTIDIELIAEMDEHPSGVRQDLFDAVDQGDDGELTRGDVRTMINSYAQDGAVDSVTIDSNGEFMREEDSTMINGHTQGVEADAVAIDRSDVRNLINWYAQQ